MVWCCKANFKTNSLRLEILKDKLYTHIFKYINYKGDHYTDSYNIGLTKTNTTRNCKSSEKLNLIQFLKCEQNKK